MDPSNLQYSSNYPSIQSTNFHGYDNRQSHILSQDKIRQQEKWLRDLSLNSPREMENDAQHRRVARLISNRRLLRSKHDSERIKLLRSERQQMNTPIMIDSEQMPMLRSISYSNIASDPAIASIPRASLPIPVPVPLPIPMTIGLIPSLHVMPMLYMRPVQLKALYPCTGSTCRRRGHDPKMLLMCGNVLYVLPPMRMQVPVCALVLPSGSSRKAGGIPKNSVNATKAAWKDPGGDDYPQDFPSDNSDGHECVPIKNDKSTDTDYPHVPGLFSSTKKPLKYHKGKKKLIIVTDKGNVTYIKPN